MQNDLSKMLLSSLPSWERGLKFIPLLLHTDRPDLSLPSWERGLKFNDIKERLASSNVAPLVGAWIEIARMAFKMLTFVGRSPRGSVD